LIAFEGSDKKSRPFFTSRKLIR